MTAIAAGAASNVVYAYFEYGIYESRDAGCSWTLRATAPPSPEPWVDQVRAMLTAGERVYVHTDLRLLRLTGDALEIFPNVPERIREMAVDPADSLHLRGISHSGAVFDSFNGGASWQRIGEAPVLDFVTAEVSPKNLDRLYGADHDHTYRSDDGGKTWTKLDLSAATVEIESSPLDENIVWFRTTDVKQQMTWLQASIDGGRSIHFSMAESAGLGFAGSMTAHIREPNVLAIAAGPGPIIVTTDGVVTRMREGDAQTIAWSPAGTLYYGVRNYDRTE